MELSCLLFFLSLCFRAQAITEAILPPETTTTSGYPWGAFAAGPFHFSTVSIPGLSTDSATTLTITQGPDVVTTAVQYGIAHTAVTVRTWVFGWPQRIKESPGLIFPPPFYQPLTVGSDGKPRPVKSTLSSSLSVTTSSGSGNKVSTTVTNSLRVSVVQVTISGKTFSETFVPTMYSQYASLTAPSTVTTQLQGRTTTMVVGASGIGWILPTVPAGAPTIPLPLALPSNPFSNTPALATSTASGGIIVVGTPTFTDSKGIATTSLVLPSTIATHASAGSSPANSAIGTTLLSAMSTPQGTSRQASNLPGTGVGAINDVATSTMTVAPTDFSTQATSNAAWSNNLLLTTTAPGSSSKTVVPVIVGCRNCGGHGGGIILWGLPKISRVTFSFPRFPKLPKVTWPCISLFGCPGGGPEQPPKSEPETPEPNPPDKLSSLQDHSTERSSCTPHTTSGCSTSCPPGSTGTKCSTSCSTVTGCSVSASHTTTTGACLYGENTAFPFGFGPDGLTLLQHPMTGPTPASTTASVGLAASIPPKPTSSLPSCTTCHATSTVPLPSTVTCAYNNEEDDRCGDTCGCPDGKNYLKQAGENCIYTASRVLAQCQSIASASA